MRLSAVLLATLHAAAGMAPCFAQPVDVNVVTALDISESVAPANHRLQLAALAAALRSPRLLAAVQQGSHGRIGVAIFTWHRNHVDVLSWSLVATAADFEAAAQAVEARLPVRLYDEARAHGPYIGRLTDLSRALDHAGELLAAAPFEAKRWIVNIVGNGADNMGEEAGPARDRLLAGGASVNGLVLDGEPGADDYYRREVVGGPGSFLIVGESAFELDRVMQRKLLGDLMAANRLSRGMEGLKR